ncbi:mechanosensitive ion channel MScS [Desulfosarcina variabilis str. Montpellier]|uniref:mechanosensitive ion channel domain-containing protein n=1 Tax=Desulfosarcina variabilis TaxID=2300 RepID=UPI003AFA57C9
MRIPPFTKHASLSLTAAVLLFHVLFFSATMADAAQEKKPSQTASSESVKESFDDALRGEQSDLVGMEQGLERWEQLRSNTIQEIESFRMQNAAHENLLIALHTRIEPLETALNANRIATTSLSERIVEFEKIGTIAPGWMAQLSDRISIAEKRMIELKRGDLSGPQSRGIRQKLKSLLDILYEKKKRGQLFLKSYTELLDKLKQTRNDLIETRRQLEIRLQSQEKSKLFERNLLPFKRLTISTLVSEIKTTWNHSAGFLRTGFWQQQWINFQRSGGTAQAIFLIVFLSAVILRNKIWRYFQSIEQRMEGPGYSMRRLALNMLRRSFLLMCAAVLLWLYDLLNFPHVNYHFARFLSQSVFTLLVTKWGVDYFQNRIDDSGSHLNFFIQNRLVTFFKILCALVITHLVFMGMFGSESVTVWVFSLAIKIFLFIWTIIYWRAIDKMVSTITRRGETMPCYALHYTARGWSYLVFGGALLIDLIGYHTLAAHWLVSWAETLALLLWASIGWRSIQEWHLSQKGIVEAQENVDVPIVAAPVGWFLVQMARLLWLSALLAGILLAWAGTDFMVESLKKFFQMDFSVGSLRVSVKGILLAVILFYVTHVATRIGRRFLSEKVLDSRNFERGLKDSIVTISSYVIWGLGILLALGMLGVNATSLAVVFGALSIGIGFGLQNIFNNFISGLILLFERPIQVGDYVEVNGLWAEVKKINVRSTIVQTFDNATVIIPNSDFISQQVTNWSFKDPRMRRHIDIGVAYGSDIELVRRTLLEIPKTISHILKYPQPDVLFMDHGESALIFRLRYWIHVDYYFSTSTDVRFELDHRFRELGIEIAFPQRDLHIRSDHTGSFSKNSDANAPEPLPDEKEDAEKKIKS